MRRWVNCIVLAVFLFQTSGCTTRRPVPVVPASPAQKAGAYDPKKGWHIVGYTTRDGLYHKYSGLARLDPTDDQVHFTPIQTSRSVEKVEAKPLVIPRERIRALEIEELTDVGQFGKVVAIALGAVLVVGIMATIYLGVTSEDEPSQGGSCPFLYAFDGERFFLEGEPYGGAIAPSLERDDWCELSTLQPLAGRYHLLLRNPADETDRTNSLQLLVADHEPGTRVVRDGLGGMHAFRRTAPLTRATDSQGRDVSRPLRAADRDEWFSDLDAIADGQEPAVLREPIEIEFARPLGTDSVWLLGRVRSTPWSGQLLQHFVEMYGGATSFATAVDADAGARARLLAWSDREELLALKVELRQGERWVACGQLAGGSPWVEEDQAVRLDLTGVPGDRVCVRVQPPTSLWVLDAFEIGWDEAPIHVTPLAPIEALDSKGLDVRAALLADDDQALVFPQQDDHAFVTFEAPPAPAAMARTVFARTRGYYELHTSAQAPADAATLAHLFGPGEIVRWSLAYYEALAGARAMSAPSSRTIK